MKKIIIIPDSFKGTLSSVDNCDISRAQIGAIFPECEVICVPVADGGEGSVDCFISALGGEKIIMPVAGPYFEEVDGFYGILSGGSTALIEMAACAGLPLVGAQKNPLRTTTYGVGQLILDAVGRGCKKVIVGLGGSATNDAGCGMAASLGVRFIGRDGPFIPVGGTLSQVLHIEPDSLPKLRDIEIITMCDIDNPLYGKNGAAYIFAPQKGATAEEVVLLDRGLRHISKIIKRDIGIDVSGLAGGGAAGGMGAAMAAYFYSELRRGIDVVLDTVRFEELLRGADLVFTGEGKLDSQSLGGKVVCGVARRAKVCGVPTIAVVGGYDADIEKIFSMGLTAVFSINRLPETLEDSGAKTGENLALTMRNILRVIKEARGAQG